ncbi:trehalose-phosphatase [Streptomyces sp. N2-109]|uniref:Trehalose 6-phosphate phosphatase n=1 Tax=Streptomyces gossypii TaxID=2883101 RepID=A0ABT2JY48_9ACTN|nr:trehalose-phosphatase [Streptomyces gossypii]MCT2592771.1 trehalose-phosphatase [Streptomyces gossypii]
MGSDSSPTPPPPSPLPAPATPAGRAGLDAVLAHPARTVVLTDFDGTLAPIVPDPEDARAHPDTSRVVARLAPHLRAFSVLTGRPAELAVRYSGFADLPEVRNLTVLGAYGAERWDAASGEVHTPAPHPGIASVREELPGLLAGEPGVHVEDKGRAVAVHTRRAEEPAAAYERLRAPLAALAARHGLRVEPGRLVQELRPPGMDKGLALREFVRETGAEAVLYAGDDLGDLAAFAAVAALREEGVAGVLVCSGSDEVTELADRADLVVDGPAGVLALFDALATSFGAAAPA